MTATTFGLGFLTGVIVCAVVVLSVLMVVAGWIG
jgi:hypothetical protein